MALVTDAGLLRRRCPSRHSPIGTRTIRPRVCKKKPSNATLMAGHFADRSRRACARWPIEGDRVVAPQGRRDATVTITRIVLIATVLVPTVASAQDSRSSVVLTTKHFAFHSDFATNVHDALIVAATMKGMTRMRRRLVLIGVSGLNLSKSERDLRYKPANSVAKNMAIPPPRSSRPTIAARWR